MTAEPLHTHSAPNCGAAPRSLRAVLEGKGREGIGREGISCRDSQDQVQSVRAYGDWSWR